MTPDERKIAAEFDIADHERLDIAIDLAIMAYHLGGWLLKDNVPNDLDRVADLLAQAMALLEQENNRRHLSAALGLLPSGMGEVAAKIAASLGIDMDPRGYGEVIGEVRRVAAGARRGHRDGPGSGRHRDPRMAAAVRVLIRYWTERLGRPLAAGKWENGEPQNRGAYFVQAAMRLIAPKGDPLLGLKLIIEDEAKACGKLTAMAKTYG